MGYKSYPLPSYLGSWNCSYSIKLNHAEYTSNPQVHGHVLVQPSHHTVRPRQPLRHDTEFIYGVARHTFRYGCLPLPDVLSNNMKY